MSAGKKQIGWLVVLVLGLGFSGLARAIPALFSTTINLGTVYAGNTPDGTAPWLTANFTSYIGSTTGTLTLTSNLSDSDFLQGLQNSNAAVGWAFYLNQSLSVVSCGSGTCANNTLFGGSYNTGPVPGVFNLAFGWLSGNRFESGDSAIYDLTFTTGLTGSPFVADSNFSSVAHVQGITGGCSGWIVNGDAGGSGGDGPCTSTPPPTTVPEPSVLGMFGLGLIGILLFVGLRRRTH